MSDHTKGNDVSGHLDDNLREPLRPGDPGYRPPGPPDPPYIPGDLGAPSAKEFARRRAFSEPRPKNPYRTVHARMSPPAAAWDEGFVCGLDWSSRRMSDALSKIADLEVVDDSDADRMREIASEALPWRPGRDDPR